MGSNVKKLIVPGLYCVTRGTRDRHDVWFCTAAIGSGFRPKADIDQWLGKPLGNDSRRKMNC
jgi:hypothetical protein